MNAGTVTRAANAALDAIAPEADEPGVIRGDRPEAASLGEVWRALHDGLIDVRRRASKDESSEPETDPRESD